MGFRKALLLAFPAAFLAYAAAAGEIKLEGTNWLFAGDRGPAPRTMAFKGGKVSGHSGCNHYGGEYRFANGRLTLEALAMTEMACQEDAMRREAEFTAILDKVRGARLEGAVLVLLGEAGNALARLKRATGG